MSRRIRHRGPDWSGIWCGGSAILAHERLSIVDPQSGGQPLFSEDRLQVRMRADTRSVPAVTVRLSWRCTATLCVPEAARRILSVCLRD